MEIATLSAHPMDELKNRLRLILNVIPPGSNIYYIDYPVYSNGGDLLIMKGTEAFFRENGIRVRARYSAFDFPDGLSVPKDHILVLQGGGNFGDLYPVHQKLRERVVAGYPNNRVVILPQTIHYKDVREFDRTADILNRHKDVHLFVRDTLSLDMAKDKFHRCGVYLSPTWRTSCGRSAAAVSRRGSCSASCGRISRKRKGRTDCPSKAPATFSTGRRSTAARSIGRFARSAR